MTDTSQWPTLKIWLAAHNQSQAAFARAMGLKPNRFAQYMSGARRMPLEVAIRVLDIANIPIRSLVSRGPAVRLKSSQDPCRRAGRRRAQGVTRKSRLVERKAS